MIAKMDNSRVMKPIFLASVLWCKFFIVYGDVNCGGSYSSNYGEISSPNYPDEYPNNANCTWTIEGAVNTRLDIAFIFLDLKSYAHGVVCNDYVEISEGSAILLNSCENVPERIITAGRKATIHFESNFIYTGKGFKLNWKALAEPLFKRTSMSWKEAFATCLEDDGLLMETNSSFEAAYSVSISTWMINRKITAIWVRAYFTPWLWLQGCFSTNTKLTGFNLKDNEAKVCKYVCSEHNYFGLQGNMCYCLNNITGEYTETIVHCVINCPENNVEVCGGNNALTIYKNGQTQEQTDCIKLQRNGTQLNPVSTKCTEQLPFICEKVPINCGSNYVQNDSSFRYPPDGSNYSNDMNCEWKIVGFKDKYIRLEVVYEIESCNDCNCDSLKVYEAAKQKDSPLMTFCGIGNKTFDSATKDVTLVFRSDRTVQSKRHFGEMEIRANGFQNDRDKCKDDNCRLIKYTYIVDSEP